MAVSVPGVMAAHVAAMDFHSMSLASVDKLHSSRYPIGRSQEACRRGSRNIRQGGPDGVSHGDISEFRFY